MLVRARDCAQLCQIRPNTGGVDAEIAASDARYGTDVDPAAGVGGGDADHHVVGKAEPEAALARLDAAFRLSLATMNHPIAVAASNARANALRGSRASDSGAMSG